MTMRTRTLAILVVVATGSRPAAAPDPTLDLLTAARRGDLGGIAQALAAGAKIDATDPDFEQTALIRTAMFGQRTAAETLLAAGANPRATSNLGRTALHWAAVSGAADVVPLLASAGAGVDARDSYDETPLDYAASAAQPAVVRALLAAGAHVDAMHSPLASRLALVVGNGLSGPPLEALVAIIERRQGLEIADSQGRTPLLVVAERAYLDDDGRVVVALLKAGANRRATDRDGHTPAALIEDGLARMTGPVERRNLLAAQAALR